MLLRDLLWGLGGGSCVQVPGLPGQHHHTHLKVRAGVREVRVREVRVRDRDRDRVNVRVSPWIGFYYGSHTRLWPINNR